MGYITEFQYSEPEKRKLIYVNGLISFITAGIFYSILVSLAESYFPYQFYAINIALCTFISFAAGTRAGRLLYGFLKNSRPVYVFFELVFIVIAFFFFLRSFIPVEILNFSEPLLDLYLVFPFLTFIIPGLLFFSLGFKAVYLVKISCGEFIDARNGAIHLTFFITAGLCIGLLFPLVNYFNPEFLIPETIYSVFPLALVPFLFLLKLPYNPVSLYAKVFEKDSAGEKKTLQTKESLFFSYLNFSFIIIYLYLSYKLLKGFTNDLFHYNLAGAAAIIFFLMAGFLLGRLFKIRPYFVYTTALFAPVFIGTAYLLTVKTETGNIFWVLSLIPVLLLFGLNLNHHIRHFATDFSHKTRFNVLDIMLLLLPFPLLVSLLLINFTYSWFFITIYLLALANLIIPAIYLAGKNVRTSLKALFFLAILITIPAVIILHITLNIPMKNELITSPVKGYDRLKDINYNSPYIKDFFTLNYKNAPVFSVNDSTIRNLKRALVPIAMYSEASDENQNILFIDGNQQFFRNPAIGLFRGAKIINPVSDSAVSYKMLPMSGRQRYVAENQSILNFFANDSGKYSIITDINNLYDQNGYPFKFRDDYHSLIKNRLSDNGIYVNIINLNSLRKDFLLDKLSSLEDKFIENIIFLFSDIIVILSSDKNENLAINAVNKSRLSDFININSEIRELFYNEYHVLSRLLFISIDELKAYVNDQDIKNISERNEIQHFHPDHEIFEYYLQSNDKFLELISSGPIYHEANRNILAVNTNLTLLKKFELAESRSDFSSETETLFQLNHNARYIPELARYIKNILVYKESYYADIAFKYEKQREWEQAKQLYHAMLAINPDNIEANYRLGILYLMLQDIDGSFTYLNKALDLDRQNPEVLYQMGVLHFSSGKIEKAIEYFKSALEFKKRSASIYKYLGLSYLRLEDLRKAEENFHRALILDPNDPEIINRLDHIKMLKEEHNMSWRTPPIRSSQLEVEKGIELDIPINRSAYYIRLDD